MNIIENGCRDSFIQNEKKLCFLSITYMFSSVEESYCRNLNKNNYINSYLIFQTNITTH